MTSASPSARGRLDRALDRIERAGNRLPEPFMLFVLLTLVVAVLSSLMAAFGVTVVLLTFVRRYQPAAGLGTVIAKMVPFVVPFWVAWVLVLTVFYAFGIPLGPGVAVRIGE